MDLDFFNGILWTNLPLANWNVPKPEKEKCVMFYFWYLFVLYLECKKANYGQKVIRKSVLLNNNAFSFEI